MFMDEIGVQSASALAKIRDSTLCSHYPLFALTMLTMMTTVSLSEARIRFVSFSGKSLLLQPFLLQQWSSLSWNYPSWSISTEAEAYIFLSFLLGCSSQGNIRVSWPPVASPSWLHSASLRVEA